MTQENTSHLIECSNVECSEQIFRSIRNDPIYFKIDDNGNPNFGVSAFNDSSEKPSVNRASIRPDPEFVKQRICDGVVTLVVGDVRAINVPIANGSNDFVVDVKHCPESHNPSHAQIESEPMPSGSRFRKIKERLAKLASIAGWTCPPK